MDEYVSGSVANIISSKNNAKAKAKKTALGLNRNDKSQTSDKKHGIVKQESLLKQNIKLRKRKLELSKNCETESSSTCSKTEKKESTVNILKNKIIKKKKNVLNSSNKLNQDPPSKDKSFKISKENNKPEAEIKLKPKKRKISELEHNEEEVITKKNLEELVDLEFVPSDSENEDEYEKINKNSIANSKNHFSSKDGNENTVFIGNIPIDYNKQKICRVFSKFGEIQNARIRCVPIADINVTKKVAAIKKQFNPKRNSLVAYVNFKSKESAESAVKASGLVIDGHHLRIDFAESNKERDNNKAVFVGGLPFDIEDDELWDFFQNCGHITSVRIIRDSHTSMGKGFGYVNFDSTAAVELALQLDGQEIKKRKINVKRCINPKNKKKLSTFGKKKSKEITTQLLCKKGKKFKEEKKKLKKENKQFSTDFQGRTAYMKQKKKKKLSKVALRQRKLKKLLGAS